MAITSRNFIRIASDNWTFQESATGNPFIPLGCNYYDPHTGWPPQFWTNFDRNRVKQHFRMMEDLGVNAIRVWIQWAVFMPTRNEMSTRSLEQCSELLSIAQDAGIRVNLTGPEFWEGCPPWLSTENRVGYQHLISPGYQEAHAAFWEQFAGNFSNEATIYGYDLVNEPFMPWDGEHLRRMWNEWLVERYGSLRGMRDAWGKAVTRTMSLGNLPPPSNRKVPGSQHLIDYQTFREEMAFRAINNTVRAIRRVDRHHLITVGLHQSGFPPEEIVPSRYTAFNPHLLCKCLDYISLHWYPFGNPYTAALLPFDLPSNSEKSLSVFLANCRYSHAGKPLVMEEFSYYGGGSPEFWGGVLPYRTEKEQEKFSRQFMRTGRGSLGGWLNWPLQDTPSAADTSAYGGFFNADGKLKAWGGAFREIADQIKKTTLRRQKAERIITIPRSALLTDAERCQRVLDECYRLMKRGILWDFRIA